MKVLLFIIISINLVLDTKENYFVHNQISLYQGFSKNLSFISNCISSSLPSKQIGLFTKSNQRCIIWSKSTYKNDVKSLFINTTFCQKLKRYSWCATETYTYHSKSHDWDYCKYELYNEVKMDYNCFDYINVISTSSSLEMNSKFFCKDQNCIIILYTEQNICFLKTQCSRDCQNLQSYKTLFFTNCKVLSNEDEHNNILRLSPLTGNTLYRIYIIPISDERNIGKITTLSLRTQPLKIPISGYLKLVSRTSSTMLLRIQLNVNQSLPKQIYRLEIISLMQNRKIGANDLRGYLYDLTQCTQYCFVFNTYYYSANYYKSPNYCFYTPPENTIIDELKVYNTFAKWKFRKPNYCMITFEGEYFTFSDNKKILTFATRKQNMLLTNLIPESNYSIRVRICLKSGDKCDVYGHYSAWVEFRTPYIEVMKTEFNPFLLLLLLFPCIIIFSYFNRRRMCQLIQNCFSFFKNGHSSIITPCILLEESSNKNTTKESVLLLKKQFDDSTNNQRISETVYNVETFVKYCEKQTQDNNVLLIKEFKSLFQKSKEYQSLNNFSTNKGKMPCNKQKNRFTDILPYDKNRVVLKGRSSDDNYINASYIPNEINGQEIEYIASQGPIKCTVLDFWKMIWDENISCIIMLTKCYENDNFKCVQYWPSEINIPCEFTSDFIMNVYLLEENNFDEYIERKMMVRNEESEEKRIIIQMQMLSWNDHSIPDMKAFEVFLFHFHKICNAETIPPYLFHCSAGVGRTGTFTVIDRIIKRIISGSQEIDIFNEILELRKFRMLMVQRENQYIFIYMFIHYFLNKYMQLAQQSEKMIIYNND